MRQGCLQKYSRKGFQQRMFFLFSDVLLYTFRTQQPTQCFRVHGQIPVKGMKIQEGDNKTGIDHVFIISGYDNQSLTVAAYNEGDKERWIEDLNITIAHADAQDAKLPYLSLKSCSTDEVGDNVGLEADRGSCGGAKASQRSNTTVHVCWHRSTSISYVDQLRAFQNQLSGFLLRKFKNSNGWQKLWVVFTSFCLFFYKSHQDDFPLASLPLLGYTVSTPSEIDGINKDFVFKLQFKSHVYFFRAESDYTFGFKKNLMDIVEGEMNNMDIDTLKPSLTSQLLLLYYLLLYEDVRLSNMHIFISQGRKVKSYSTEFLSELPIKYLLQQVQRDQVNYAGLFSPLLRLLATHFPHLSLVDDWLDDEMINIDSPTVNYESTKITDISIVEAFSHINKCPSRTGRLLRQLMAMKPTDIWPHTEIIIHYFKAILDDRVPRYIQELYKQVWLRLNTVLPRCLWVLSINTLLVENMVVKNIFLTQENIVLDPLQVLRCDTRVFRCAPVLSVILRILQAVLAASRSQLSRHTQDRPLTEKVGQLSSETEREDLKTALIAGQESAAVQILLEACLETKQDRQIPGQMWSLREIRSVICSYLHQIFIADPSLAKLVHFQGYPRELLPITVSGIPSMHICLDWIPELLSQPEPEKQVFAVDLASHLAIQYALPKALSVSRLAINTLITLLGVLPAKDRVSLFMPVLPSLTRICLAFPPLAEDTTILLLQLGRVNSAQAALGDKSADALCQKVNATFCTLLSKAILQSQIY